MSTYIILDDVILILYMYINTQVELLLSHFDMHRGCSCVSNFLDLKMTSCSYVNSQVQVTLRKCIFKMYILGLRVFTKYHKW